MSVLVKAWKMELFLYECPGKGMEDGVVSL